MANHARGEADLVIAGKTYPVRMSMGALARMSAALQVNTFTELSERIQKFNLADMPVVIDAVLKGNNHEVPMADIEAMDWQAYFSNVIPAFFRHEEKPAENGDARPPRRQKA
jgi:Phage tail tube protein, GTA-gp10